MEKGKFITLEGIEGVGKTTALENIITVCRESLGKEVINTREPGGTPIAEHLRDILLEENDEKVNIKTELLLFFAGRSQHVSEIIEPSLRKGFFVVSDRFVDATYAYQGAGRGIASTEIDTLVDMVHPKLKPDITFLLDAPLSICLERINTRVNKDRFEKEHNLFFEKVRERYLQRATEEPDRIKIIDATRTKKEVSMCIKKELLRLFSC